MLIKNVEPSIFYDQVVKKLDAVGAFIFQTLFLLVMAYLTPKYTYIYIILFFHSNSSFLGKIIGTIIGMLIMSRDKKN